MSGTVRAREQQDITRVVRAIVERLAAHGPFASKLRRYVYATRHHYRPKIEPINWQFLSELLATDLVGEPRAFVGLEGSAPGMTVWISLNFTLDMTKELVAGKRRNVPEPSDSSRVGISAVASFLTDATFVDLYRCLMQDVFGMIGGAYGTATHDSVKNGNVKDRENALWLLWNCTCR